MNILCYTAIINVKILSAKHKKLLTYFFIHILNVNKFN